MAGFSIQGVRELLDLAPVPVHVQADEAPWVTRVTDAGADDLVTHAQRRRRDGGRDPDRADPHARATRRAASASWSTTASSPATPSSSRAAGAPTCPAATRGALREPDPELAKVPDDAVLFPGHLYSAEPSATMGETRKWNYVFRPRIRA